MPHTNGQRNGRLVVFLGAAAGVGKTYAMLGEARLAVEDGVDLVLGYLEPHGRAPTEERARGLTRAPVVTLGPGGRAGTELDVPWLLERRPSVVVVDELAHAYAIGDPPRRRYQDVLALREHGIEVWTTVNVQHIESLSERVRALTGVTIRETIPDHLVHGADELRLVDLAPAALRERIARGLVYPAERVENALTGFFTIAKLTALRALVLHELAEVAAAQYAAVSGERLEGGVERVLVAVTGGSDRDARLVREAVRVARRVDGELVVIALEREGERDRPADLARLADIEALSAGLGATFMRRRGRDATEVLTREAEALAATRIVLWKPPAAGFARPQSTREIAAVLRGTRGVDLVVLADDRLTGSRDSEI